MNIEPRILEQVIDASAEPLVIARIDHPDWPVELSNHSFDAITGADVRGQSLADVVEKLVGREMALEVSESVRARRESSFAVELNGRELLLTLKPLAMTPDDEAVYYVAYWRSGAGGGAVAGSDMHHELLQAKRRIRDLSRDDPVTGLLNAAAFREVLEHDWAVASREKSALGVVVFDLDEFDAYLEVFGRHASDSCLRRVGQTVRRCMRRASDVVGRMDGATIVVLSHAASEESIDNFALRISTSVRELGLHHPRSSASKFVTVSYRLGVSDAGESEQTAEAFLNDLLSD